MTCEESDNESLSAPNADDSHPAKRKKIDHFLKQSFFTPDPRTSLLAPEEPVSVHALQPSCESTAEVALSSCIDRPS